MDLDDYYKYQSRWRDNHPDYQKGYQKEYNRQHTLMVNGRRIVVNKRPRPDTCEVCAKPAAKLDWHHWDDDHPHLGLWLCFRCHHTGEGVDRGLHTIYLQKKSEVIIKYIKD